MDVDTLGAWGAVGGLLLDVGFLSKTEPMTGPGVCCWLIEGTDSGSAVNQKKKSDYSSNGRQGLQCRVPFLKELCYRLHQSAKQVLRKF